MKANLSLLAAALFLGLPNTLSAETILYQHDFDDGELYPFMYDTNQGSRVTIVDGTLQTKWEEELYDGTNMGRKAQFYPEYQDGWHTQELWLGYHMKISSDYMADDYDTDAGLMQVWGFDDSTGKANHFIMLQFEGRNGGQLTWSHRYMFNTSTKYLITDDFPRDEFVSVIIHVKLADVDEGIVQVWIDGELKLDKTEQTIGWGDMNENGMYNLSHFGAAMGQYNYRESAGYDSTYDSDSHYYLGHKEGETRTVTFDNFSMYYDASDAYDIVNPDRDTDTTTDDTTTDDANSDSSEPVVQMIKRNASAYAIDGNFGGADEQDVYLWEEGAGNVNQQWYEIDRGDGYYSYQKVDTSFCLDGNKDGEDGQNVYLWTCSDNNYNQHWLKVDMGDGYYRLEKRNASDYSLDGNNSGDNGQSIYLWSSDDGNQNQHWYFNYLSGSSD